MNPDKKGGFWKLLVRAVMKIYNMRFFFLNLSFGKLLSSQDNKKSNRKVKIYARFMNSNAFPPVRYFTSKNFKVK